MKSLQRDENHSLIEAIVAGYDVIFESIQYPSGFNINEFENLPNYSARVKYAASHLEKIGKGSSRTVYRIDDEHVLKLAHNDKGIAQNNIEADGYIQQAYPDIVANVVESSPDKLWIVVEKAKRITKSRFKQLTGFPFEEFAKVLQEHIYKIEGRRYPFALNAPDANEILTDEFFEELVDMIRSMDLEVGDLTKINSYGEIDDDAVVTDPGLSKQVWKEHYDRNVKKARY
jgi:hypothetical protein